MSEALSFSLRANTPVPLEIYLNCPAGEICVLAGPSGSGKTTILRALAGLHKPEAGFITIGNKSCYDSAKQIWLPPQRRPVGLVFQHYALFPHLNALDNIAIALNHLPRSQRQAKAQSWLNLVRLGKRAQARPETLSGGERQRLALARALAREPAALLLDEPFAAIDLRLRQDLYRELAVLRDQLGLAILLVTHELDEAFMVADRLALIEGGRLLQSGPPEQVRRHPADARVARQLGRENLFKGELRDGKLHWNGRQLQTEASGPNGPIWWSVAPDDLSLSDPPAGPTPAPHSLAAELKHCVRLGSHWHLTLALGNARLRAVSDRAWSPGPIALTIPPAAIQLIVASD